MCQFVLFWNRGNTIHLSMDEEKKQQQRHYNIGKQKPKTIKDNQIFIHRKDKTGKNKRFDLNPDHSIASKNQSLNSVPIFWPFVRRI